MTDNKRRIRNIFLGLLVLALFGAFHTNRRQEDVPPVSGTAFKLNTVVNVTIYDKKEQTLVEEALALCDKYEDIFSRTRESSELYRLNHGLLPQDADGFLLSDELSSLIRTGLKYAKLSGGGFDIAVEPVSSLWDFTSAEKTVPEADAVAEALPLVDYRDISLEGNHLRFAREGMGIDLGAIAKGRIADEIKAFLISRGVESATINLGGNVLCIGTKPDGASFRIGIQKPFADRSETCAVVSIAGGSVVSSGTYERYFEKDGRFYHHILNPATGFPYENGLTAVSILSETSTDGDALSTACFALGLKKGLALIERLPDTEALFITSENELHYSSGFPN